MCFMFNIETLGTESTSIVLSAALTHFELSPELYLEKYGNNPVDIYNGFVKSSCFVTMSVKEQREVYGRYEDPDALAWWKKQSQLSRDVSLDVDESRRLSVSNAFDKLYEYIDKNGGGNQIFWMRGSLDQLATESLAKNAGKRPLAEYHMWRDVRTAIDILATNANSGYCEIPGFKPDVYVIKHIPQNDCALDIMMMLYHV